MQESVNRLKHLEESRRLQNLLVLHLTRRSPVFGFVFFAISDLCVFASGGRWLAISMGIVMALFLVWWITAPRAGEGCG